MTTSQICRMRVAADDGVPLLVTSVGRTDAPVTVVFLHGHCQRSESWADVRDALAADVRTVCYDHRGHGDSGAGAVHTYNIEQLAHDLDAVLRAVVPAGPVILVGHSMGAMAVLTHIRWYQESVGSRIVGIALIATAAGSLTHGGLGRWLRRPLVSMLGSAVRGAPNVLERSKRLSRKACEPIVRKREFGSRTVNPKIVALATAMLNETPVPTMTGFLPSFIEFDETETLATLAVPCLVIGGSDDHITPFERSADIAERTPGAELVRIEGGGHSVILDRAGEVAEALTRFVRRVRTGAVCAA